MTKTEELRRAFREAADPEAFIRSHSGLPGPRGNLELAQAVADEGDERMFQRLIRWGPERAPVNTPEEFLPVCGVVGLGRLVAEGRIDLLRELRAFASDSRWRTREAVAIALQRWGRVNLGGLLAEMRTWTRGNRYEQRAVVAALCEPVLLRRGRDARSVMGLLDRITREIDGAPDRATEPFRVLRQALGYGWSVVVAASPQQGIPRLDRWMRSSDPDVRWVMRENLKKKRLIAVAGERSDRWRELLDGR